MSTGGPASEFAESPATWVCPETRLALEARDELLVTGDGGREYEVVDGIPIFALDETGQRRAEQRGSMFDELLQRMEGSSSEDAANWFCRQHGCTREPYATDWKYLLAPPARGKVLELGAGFGDDSITLAGDPSRIVLVVPTLANARVLQRRLDGQTPGPWPIAVLPSLERLPLADGSVGAIVLEEAAFAGFGLSEQNFARIAAEWKRVLREDGVVFLGLSNPLHRLPGLASMRSRLSAPVSDSMNRTLKRAQTAAGSSPLRAGTAIREMRREGFGDPTVYAPLPSENRTDVVLPAQDRTATDYFLDRLVRKNSPVTRTAISMARLASKLGWFPHLVPYHYLFFKIAGVASSRGRETS